MHGFICPKSVKCFDPEKFSNMCRNLHCLFERSPSGRVDTTTVAESAKTVVSVSHKHEPNVSLLVHRCTCDLHGINNSCYKLYQYTKQLQHKHAFVFTAQQSAPSVTEPGVR